MKVSEGIIFDYINYTSLFFFTISYSNVLKMHVLSNQWNGYKYHNDSNCSKTKECFLTLDDKLSFAKIEIFKCISIQNCYTVEARLLEFGFW